MSDYRDLVVWRKAIKLAEDIYVLTGAFPRDERFGLVSQIRRAAVSVASNIAEGQARGNDGYFVQILGISRGSLHELETQVTLAGRLGFLPDESEAELLSRTAEIGKLLSALINSLDRALKRKRAQPR